MEQSVEVAGGPSQLVPGGTLRPGDPTLCSRRIGSVRESPYTPRVNVPEVQYARNGEVSIAYQVVGEGPQDLTFVTGFVSHLELFWEAALVRRFFERLSSFSRLILWDKREQGL
jgi:hypothetical protein